MRTAETFMSSMMLQSGERKPFSVGIRGERSGVGNGSHGDMFSQMLEDSNRHDAFFATTFHAEEYFIRGTGSVCG